MARTPRGGGNRVKKKNPEMIRALLIGGGRTPVQFRLRRLNSNAAGVSGNGRGRDQALRFKRSTSAWKAGVSSAIRVSMSRT